MSVEAGSRLRVHYTGMFEDGAEFDSSRGREPLECTLGRGMLPEGFEAALIGREAGDRLRVTTTPEQAYGNIDPTLFFETPWAEIPRHITPVPGLRLFFSSPDGDMEVSVSRVDARGIVLDANHPLAGKTLLFDIEIVSVE